MLFTPVSFLYYVVERPLCTTLAVPRIACFVSSNDKLPAFTIPSFLVDRIVWIYDRNLVSHAGALCSFGQPENRRRSYRTPEQQPKKLTADCTFLKSVPSRGTTNGDRCGGYVFMQERWTSQPNLQLAPTRHPSGCNVGGVVFGLDVSVVANVLKRKEMLAI